MQYRLSILLSFLFFTGSLLGKGNSCEIQGHRGCRARYPENTLPAFQAAIYARADAIELDLLLTRDGHFVIYHDEFINDKLVAYRDGRSLTSLGPLVYSLTFAEVKEFDCGLKTNPAFPQQRAIPGTPIPTLEELFALIRTSKHPHAKKIRVNLEIKRDPLHPEYTASPAELVDRLLPLVAASGLPERISYSSFDPEVLFELRKRAPEATIAFLQENTPVLDNMLETAAQLKAQIVSPKSIFIQSPEQIREMQEQGFKVVLWTVNEPEEWKKFIEWGVDGLITDDPAALRHYLKTHK